jgi:hypothetical protein
MNMPFLALRRALPVLAGVLAVTGCSTIQSSDLKTSGMQADFTVISDGSSTTELRASILANNTTYVDLASGDRLRFFAGTKEASSQSKTNIAGIITYSSTFSGVNPGQEFRVALERANDTSAPSSTVTLPPAAEITDPPANVATTRSADLTVRWDVGDSGDRIAIEADGNCIFNKKIDDLPNTGSYVIRAGTLESTGGSSPTTCTVNLEVSRVRRGTVDSAFGKGGAFTALQTRKVAISSAP